MWEVAESCRPTCLMPRNMIPIILRQRPYGGCKEKRSHQKFRGTKDIVARITVSSGKSMRWQGIMRKDDRNATLTELEHERNRGISKIRYKIE
jgi:hypothetical protein